MKKQDIMTPVGLILAVGLVVYGASLGSAGIAVLWDLPSVFITVGGSLAAVLITFSADDIKELPKITLAAFKTNNISKVDLIDQFKELSRKARKEGLLSIEEKVSQIEDSFLKKGLEMAIDGIQEDILKEILESDISQMERRHENGANRPLTKISKSRITTTTRTAYRCPIPGCRHNRDATKHPFCLPYINLHCVTKKVTNPMVALPCAQHGFCPV